MASGKSVSKTGIMVKTEASYDVYVFLLLYLMHISLHWATVTQKSIRLSHCILL